MVWWGLAQQPVERMRWEGDEVSVLRADVGENCKDHRDIGGGAGGDGGAGGGRTLNVAMIDLTFFMSVQSSQWPLSSL